MSAYKKYRSRQIVEAKQVDHEFGVYDPVTSRRQEGRPGDYLLRTGNTDRVIPREVFTRDYEPLED